MILIVLGITLSGYLFSSIFINTKYRLPKYQGHHLLYKSLFLGTVFYILSSICFTVSWPLFSKSSLLFDWFSIPYPSLTQQQFNFIIIIFNTILIAMIFAKSGNSILFYSFNYLLNKSRERSYVNDQQSTALALAQRECNTEGYEAVSRKITDEIFDLLVYKKCTDNNYISHVISCYINPSLLLLTLDTNKCYVCYVYEIKTPNDHQESQDFTVIPVSTGYRHEDDLCLELTTNYDVIISYLKMTRDQYFELPDSERKKIKADIMNFRLTIPHEKIVSIASFDLAHYKGFKESENIRRVEIDEGRNPKKDERVVNS